ncbi:glycosyltransferase family 2 protein [Rhizobium sp. P44RR-XXIV]|uniref:glycosyltransferase family 2 protein n=1 Tax=Rhizobium sp. P44RR-XXIV TaxID=1921145 RepID=UPI00098748DD|nr:glycosyltransferase family 2 protein [Rhizobium sp. P44RR-XXIV]TIX87749.1 glycosyltransferase family 2 protein [Rhizobium sp. P44RR-XXIV]
MKIAVGVATSGRKAILACMIDRLAAQTRKPDHLFLSPATDDDIDMERLRSAPFPVSIISSPKGSCPQRNAIIHAAAGMDMLTFFDDDFFPATNYLAETEALLEADENIVVATGHVIYDGIGGPGLTVEEADRILKGDADPDPAPVIEATHNAYGCNMTFRLQPILTHHVYFDEELPLYAWQEDVDLCRRLRAYGTIVRFNRLRGVHLGAKVGRTSGLRFGYSQIANPLYLVRKRTVSLKWALRLMGGNVASNIVGSIKPPPYIDRRGRLRGNLVALRHLLSGSLDPKYITNM